MLLKKSDNKNTSLAHYTTRLRRSLVISSEERMLSVSSFGRAGPPCRFDATGINPSTRAEDNCTRQRTVQRQQVHASRDLSLKSAKRRERHH